MKQGGRPRRSEERPDSAFGERLKEHLRRVKDFTQAELAEESLIAERTLSHMVKGKRTSGTALRRDLRAIIEVLYQRKALNSLEEANLLMTKFPAIKELDQRDPDDVQIIELFSTPVAEIERATDQNTNEAANQHGQSASESRDHATVLHGTPAPMIVSLQIRFFPVSETTEEREKEAKNRLWWSILVLLVIILGAMLSIIGLILSKLVRF